MKLVAWTVLVPFMGSGCSPEETTANWQSPTLVAEQPKEVLRFHFGWPVPGSVHVTETSEKKGNTATATYDFTLSPIAGSQEILARFENYRLRRINGSDTATRPAASSTAESRGASTPSLGRAAPQAALGAT